MKNACKISAAISVFCAWPARSAEHIGISQTHMSNLECNRVKVSLKLLLRIANVLDCKIDQLLDSRAALEWVNVKRAPEPPQQEYTLEEVRQLLELLRVTSK